MKVSIVEKLDLRKFDESIFTYEATVTTSTILNSMRYIIMSKETLRSIAEQSLNFEVHDSGVYSYKGMRIAIDDGLDYGEVDIR